MCVHCYISPIPPVHLPLRTSTTCLTTSTAISIPNRLRPSSKRSLTSTVSTFGLQEISHRSTTHPTCFPSTHLGTLDFGGVALTHAARCAAGLAATLLFAAVSHGEGRSFWVEVRFLRRCVGKVVVIVDVEELWCYWVHQLIQWQRGGSLCSCITGCLLEFKRLLMICQGHQHTKVAWWMLVIHRLNVMLMASLIACVCARGHIPSQLRSHRNIAA